ncbi:hypothetical protein NX059_002822 [Plenodomus lindquistii]|nr:hypothetical protein NX059_002822 [Plenodomus lindquistii]
MTTTEESPSQEPSAPRGPPHPRRPPSPQKPAKHAKPFSSFAEDLHTYHTDARGAQHCGSTGLFDDPDEIEAAAQRREHHELRYHEAQIRRMQQWDARDRLKQKKEERRVAQGKSPKPWYSKMFGKSKEQKGEVGSAGSGAADDEKIRETSAGTAPRGRGYEYVIVRRRPTPEAIYTENDVDDVESAWLEACGMVRVMSDDRGGCHIVPKSSIQSSEKKEQ